MNVLLFILLPLVHCTTVLPTIPIPEPIFDEKEIVKIYVTQPRSSDGGLTLTLDNKNKGKSHIHLKKAGSILSPNFAILDSTEDADCSTTFKDITHTVNMSQIEDQMYTNHEHGSYLHIAGDIVHGFLDGETHIRSLDSRDGSHEIQKVKREEVDIIDFVEPPMDLKKFKLPSTSSDSDRASYVTIYPELFVFLDQVAAEKISRHFYYIYYYLIYFYGGVNNLFRTMNHRGLRVDIRLAGWYVIQKDSCTDRNIFTSNAVGGNSMQVNGYKVLYDFGYTLYNLRRGLKYDIAYLMTGRDLMYYVNGGYSSALAGLAFVGTACLTYNNMEYRIGVGEDRKGSYNGVWTAAHEIAHILGSYHDGDYTSSDCCWNDGYLMSYKGWGTRNKLHFSNCTADAIKRFSTSTLASCLRSFSGAYLYYAAHSLYLPGRRYSADRQCASYLGAGARKPSDYLGDELCRNLKCKLGSNTYQLNIPALEGTYCNRSRLCRHGDCRT